VGQVAHQTDAVKVFGDHPLAVKLECVDSARQLRPLGVFGGVGKGIELERRGNVHAAPACRAKRVYRFGKAADLAFNAGVLQVLPGELRKGAVDEG
jgi:hypothetical protein